MTHISEIYRPHADRLDYASATDPILLELGMIEVQQDNARLRQIVAELLVKNQILRWALHYEGTPDVLDLHRVAPEKAA